MKWYLSLTINQRINLKKMCVVICGLEYNFLISLFGLKNTIEIIYEKLKQEGFDV